MCKGSSNFVFSTLLYPVSNKSAVHMLRKLKFVFLLVLFYLEIRKIETKCPVHYLRISAFFERLLLNLICLPL